MKNLQLKNTNHLSEKAPRVRFLRIKLTDRCNMRCQMCGQWRLQQIKSKSAICQRKELNIRQWRVFIESLPYQNLTVYLWGGEPFLYKELIELIRAVKKRNYQCIITTNGYFLFQNAEAIVKSGLDFLEFSVDASPKLHNEIRGLKGAFEKIERGLKLIKKIKRKLESLSPLLIMRSTISPYNASFVGSIFNSAQRLKIELLILQPYIYVPHEDGLKYQSLMKESFNCNASSWRGFSLNSAQQINTNLKKDIYSLAQKKWNYFISLSPALYAGRIHNYFNNYENTFGLFCQSPWNAIGILPDGDVTFCDDFPDYILGNIREDRLSDIWNNERAKGFRRVLLEKIRLPICNRCCGLFREF